VTLSALEVLFSTPAVRRVTDEPIDDQAIWTVLDAAVHGPYKGDDPQWAWIVVRDQATRDRIGAIYRHGWETMAVGRRAKLRRILRRFAGERSWTIDPPEAPQTANDRAGDHLAEHIQDAPVWIVAVRHGIEGRPTLDDAASIYGAVQQLMLAARALGIGSVLTTMHREREREVMEVLGLPGDARPLAIVPLGRPASGGFARPKRPPVETVVHWDRWGAVRARPPPDGS